MKYSAQLKCLGAIVGSAAIAISIVAADKKDAKQPSEAEMIAAMTELSKPGDNHKLLAESVGTWTYVMKYWNDPKSPVQESTGVRVTKELLGGRYFSSEHFGKVEFPGPDGKMMTSDFKGIGTDAYDNVKKKFLSTWIDNMSTGIMISEGTYDPAKKTFTYHAEIEMMPGMKSKVREILTITDKDHQTFTFYEDRGSGEYKSMEIKYTRKP